MASQHGIFEIITHSHCGGWITTSRRVERRGVESVIANKIGFVALSCYLDLNFSVLFAIGVRK